jgi:uncharacterized protein (TIGR03067 family)
MLTTALVPMLVAVLAEPQPLAGTWQLSRVEQDGVAGKGDPSCFLVIRGGTFTLVKDGEVAMAGEVTIDRRAGTIDFSQDGRLLMPCLVRRNGDTLRLCIPEGDQRPAAFGAWMGSMQGVSTFRRVK